jgi:hypothetical protein
MYTLVKTNVLVNKVDQASEISEHIITLKRRLVDAIYAIYNPFTNLNCHYTIKDKKILQLCKIIK